MSNHSRLKQHRGCGSRTSWQSSTGRETTRPCEDRTRVHQNRKYRDVLRSSSSEHRLTFTRLPLFFETLLVLVLVQVGQSLRSLQTLMVPFAGELKQLLFQVLNPPQQLGTVPAGRGLFTGQPSFDQRRELKVQLHFVLGGRRPDLGLSSGLDGSLQRRLQSIPEEVLEHQ